MSWQHLDENNNISDPNEPPWSLLKASSQSIPSHTRWIYSDPLQHSYRPTMATFPLDQRFFSPSIDDSTPPFDGSFEDSVTWEHWEAWKEVEKEDEAGANGEKVEQPPWFDLAAGSPKTMIPTLDHYSQTLGSSESPFTSIAQTHHDPSRSMPGGDLKMPPNGYTESSRSPSSVIRKHVELSEAGEPEINRPRVQFAVGQVPGMVQTITQPCGRPNFLLSPPASIPSATTPGSENCRRKDSSSASVEFENRDRQEDDGPFQRQQRITEKRYRSNVSDGFVNLRQALPDELIPEVIIGKRGEKFEKKDLSRAQTLALALAHIKQLERKQQVLRTESLILEGQVALYENWVGRARSTPG